MSPLCLLVKLPFFRGAGVDIIRIMLVMCLLATVPGCSDGRPRRYPVQGHVAFPDGNQLKSGTIEFLSLDHDPSITATGTITEEGTFFLGTFSTKDGAVAGRHRVVVLGDHEVSSSEERPWKLPHNPVHPRFGDFDTSGLEVTVEPRRNDITITIDYATDTH